MKNKNQLPFNQNEERQISNIYLTGAIFSLVGLIGIITDVIIGTITGGNLAALPQSAVDRFAELNQNPLLGLYHLDLLNSIVQLLLIIPWFALYIAHRRIFNSLALLSFIVYLFGSGIMVANNTALPMLELSGKFFATTVESERTLFSAAGEALLAVGAHGSPGIFAGFFIPNIANLMISVVMLKGGIFSRLNAWFGIAGSIFMMFYVILINFTKSFENIATAIAFPGGLLLMVWMIMFAVKFIRLAKTDL